MATMMIGGTEKKTRVKKAAKPVPKKVEPGMTFREINEIDPVSFVRHPAKTRRVEMMAEFSDPKLKYEIGVRTQRLCDPFMLATAPNLNKLLGGGDLWYGRISVRESCWRLFQCGSTGLLEGAWRKADGHGKSEAQC